MFGAALISFRETLEAALIVGILAAATRGLAGRARWLGIGVCAGLVGAGLVAIGAEAIANMASGMGQELFNATVLAIAVVMLSWHCIWMSRHGAELAAQARGVAQAVKAGSQTWSAVVLIVAVAVLREGSETVLFLYGIASSAGSQGMLSGGLLGVAAGVVCGYAIYAGLVRVPVKWFFNATTALILLLAAGMASQAAKFLIQADWLPPLVDPVWDSSHWLPQDSALGVLLHSLAGYDARPALTQMLFFAAVLVGIWMVMQLVNRRGVVRQ